MAVGRNVRPFNKIMFTLLAGINVWFFDLEIFEQSGKSYGKSRKFVQMKLKELTKTFTMISNIKKTFRRLGAK